MKNKFWNFCSQKIKFPGINPKSSPKETFNLAIFSCLSMMPAKVEARALDSLSFCSFSILLLLRQFYLL